MSAPKTTTKILLAGWLLAVGWLAALPGVLPLVFAGVAWLDGEHGIELRGGSGVVKVVLTHGAQNLGKRHDQIHEHRLLGRVLTCCAQSPRGQTDHVLSFGADGGLVVEHKATVVEPVPEAAVPEVLCVEDVIKPPVFARAGDFRGAFRFGGSPPRIPAPRHALLI